VPSAKKKRGAYYKGKYTAPGAEAPRRASKEQRQIAARVVATSVSRITGLEQPVLSKFLPILRAAHDEVARDLLEWTQKEEGSNRFTAQRLRSAYAQMDESIKALKQLDPALTEALDNNSEHVKQLAAHNMQEEMGRLGHVFTGEVTTLDIDQAVAFAKGDDLVLGRHAKSARRYHTWVRGALKRELAIGSLRGETIDELSTRLEKRIPAVFEHARWRAERIARTETINAYNTYHQETIREAHRIDPKIGMRWDASSDSRLCAQCHSLDGMIISVEDEFSSTWRAGDVPRHATIAARVAGKKSSATVDHPPAHPNCRCTLIPWSEDWPEMEGLEDEDFFPPDEQPPPPKGGDVGLATPTSEEKAEKRRERSRKAAATRRARRAAAAKKKAAVEERAAAQRAAKKAAAEQAQARAKKAAAIRKRKEAAQAKKAAAAVRKAEAAAKRLAAAKRKVAIAKRKAEAAAKRKAKREIERKKKAAAAARKKKAAKVTSWEKIKQEAARKREAKRKTEAAAAEKRRKAAKKPVPVQTAAAKKKAKEQKEIQERTLAKGQITSMKDIGEESTGQVFLVTMTDPETGATVDAVFKPASGEMSGLRKNVKPGTYWRRDGAAWTAADALGVGDLVPPTFARDDVVLPGTKKKVKCSVQLFESAKGSLKGNPENISKHDLERMRVFDFVTGNSDRHDNNILYQKKPDGTTRPVMIDNNLIMPKGAPTRMIQPYAILDRMDVAGNPLTAATRRSIKKLDEVEIARALYVDAGMDREEVLFALRRLRRLKRKPELLAAREELPHENTGAWYREGMKATRTTIGWHKKDLSDMEDLLDIFDAAAMESD
jgi:SPP1 gp7 family putative phage head morphogenesis protein